MAKPIVTAVFRKRDVLIAVCKACDGDGKALRRSLERALADRGRGKTVRVVASSCLDVCPKNAVAVAVADRRRLAGVEYFALAGAAACEALVDRIA
ncbi:MAG: hypothetical protein NVS3B17_13270 [Vulcanimicrobiaceae bacterium]